MNGCKYMTALNPKPTGSLHDFHLHPHPLLSFVLRAARLVETQYCFKGELDLDNTQNLSFSSLPNPRELRLQWREMGLLPVARKRGGRYVRKRHSFCGRCLGKACAPNRKRLFL